MHSRTLARSIQLVLAGIVAGTITAPVVAQTQTPDGETNRLEPVVVTGSRIKRVDMETSQPVLTLERIDLERTGLTSVYDVLSELTTNGASYGLQVNSANTSGSSTVDLRGCGANRTLVLVNGRRWVAELDGSVDLSTVPFAAIERVEVLKDGASSIYGADAICGVVNITLRDTFDGAQATVYVGEYDKGDGRRESYDATWGGSNETTSLLINLAHTHQESVMDGDREISFAPLYGFPPNTSFPGRASPTNPYGSFNVPGRGLLTLDRSATGCRPNQPCAPSVGLSDFRPYDNRTDGYNFAPENYLLQPQDTQSVFGAVRHQLTDNIRLRADMLYNERTSQARLAAQPLTGVRLDANSIYNPFGVTLTGVAFRPTINPRTYNVDQDTVRYSVGLDGQFDLWDRGFYWDVNYGYADNQLVQIKRGFFHSALFAQATGPSFIEAGVARCGTPDAPIAGCVPFNLAGGQAGLTPEMFSAVTVAPRNVTYQESNNATANISGEILELPGGMLSFAAGLEYRKEAGYFDPDPLTQSGQVLGDVPATPTRGSYDLTEAYLELAVPLLRDVPFAKSLELSLATRHSDYSNFGTTNNPKAGLRWQVVDDLMFRGSYSEGFRAPSISELFAGQATGYPNAMDPCSSGSSIFQESADVRARCAAAGVPTDYDQSAAQVRYTSGGNPNLEPETARTRTLGFVYSPGYVEGLSVMLDWYRLQIANNIGSLGAQSILDDCYIGNVTERCALITRDLAGTEFGNPGEIRQVLGINRNFDAGLEVEGYDFTIDYRFATGVGDFQLNWDNAYIAYYGDLNQPARGERNGDDAPSSGNQVGTQFNNSAAGSLWRLQSRLSATWSRDSWTATLGATYTSAVQENCNGVANTAANLGQPELSRLCSNPDRVINIYEGTGESISSRPSRQAENTLDATWYFDAQGSWKTPWNGRITAGIRNLFDKDPPVCFSCFANNFESNYRIPGRFYYMSYQQTF
ncbi:TonB-dependent receptor domain-containing protein [Tahibacter amnicola]|uniref:TonB-dependent receptor n=1 Tax=Tahibacter amnicola TaxID=2976241 RepID=A0ABY6BAT6_9GAMM|nr:TonB-dependent receptor [Tahibacter amnicola]UXI66260.1 TonB-dependent receptor [Tahibacter amnicola]